MIVYKEANQCADSLAKNRSLQSMNYYTFDNWLLVVESLPTLDKVELYCNGLIFAYYIDISSKKKKKERKKEIALLMEPRSRNINFGMKFLSLSLSLSDIRTSINFIELFWYGNKVLILLNFVYDINCDVHFLNNIWEADSAASRFLSICKDIYSLILLVIPPGVYQITKVQRNKLSTWRTIH